MVRFRVWNGYWTRRMATSPPCSENEGDLKSMCCCCLQSPRLGEVKRVQRVENKRASPTSVAAAAAARTAACSRRRPRAGGLGSFRVICVQCCRLGSGSRTKQQQQHMGAPTGRAPLLFCELPLAANARVPTSGVKHPEVPILTMPRRREVLLMQPRQS